MNWMPVWAFPNITLDESVEGNRTALVPGSDARVQELVERHPNFRTFMSRFSDTHGEPIEPALIIQHERVPKGFESSDALGSFRDVVVAATVPKATSMSIVHRHVSGLVPYSNFFWVYPWMIDREYRFMIALTPAITGVHDADALNGQSSPEVFPASLERRRMDIPLLEELLRRWETMYGSRQPGWRNIALFRSLNMVNQACLTPGGRDVVMYDYGRVTALWVAAFEILVHPEGNEPANKAKVFELLEKIPWIDSSSGYRRYTVRKRGRRVRKNLACWLYEQIYNCRNDFLHGNRVGQRRLHLPGSRRLMTNHAPTLFRLALSSFLSLAWKEPPAGEEEDWGRWVEYDAQREGFRRQQTIHEQALKLCRVSVEQQRRERQERVDAARARSRAIGQAIANREPGGA